mgnify:CR=1 FL=1|tara:strand:+ start:1112 stop:1678 length:567 start_codon:yes stop_codon:yes gene_type:complete
MKKIGITGSLASGKTTASKILSSGKGPLFNADVIVKNFYKRSSFRRIISKRFNIKNTVNIKRSLKNKIKEDETNIQKLEKIVHPLVRREMYKFIRKNKKKRFIFLEIPLLIESKLMNYFDIIFFIKARKSIRLRRFLSKGGKREIFNILNKKQLTDTVKIKYSDYVVVNEKKFKVLKENLLNIFKKYE